MLHGISGKIALKKEYSERPCCNGLPQDGVCRMLRTQLSNYCVDEISYSISESVVRYRAADLFGVGFGKCGGTESVGNRKGD